MRRALTDLVAADRRAAFSLDVEERPTHIAAVVGTALHEYAQTGSRDWAEMMKVRDAFIFWDDITPSPDVAYRQLERMANAFAEAVPGWLDALCIEKSMTADFPSTIKGIDGITLTGHPDRIDNDGVLYDIKTGHKLPGAFAPQLGAYALLAKRHGIDLTGVRILYVGRRDAVVSYDTYDLELCLNEAKAALRQLAVVAAATGVAESNPRWHVIESPGAIHTNPRSSLCRPRYCRAYGMRFCTATKHLPKESEYN